MNRLRPKTQKQKKNRRTSKRKQQEPCAESGSLQESQEWYRLIVNSCTDFAIFSTNIDGCISSWNPGAERFFGYKAKEILGKPMDILYTPEDRAADMARKERDTAARDGTSEDERWHLRKGGTRFFVSGRVNPMYTDQGELCGFIKIARDITERRELQTRLDSTEELHRLILQNIPDFAIFTTDPSGIIETWNTGAENIFGYSGREVLGQHFDRLLTPEDRAKGEPEKSMAASVKNERLTEEHWAVRKDGSRVFVTGVMRPLFDGSHAVRGFCKVVRDITARRKLQDQLERSHSELEQLIEQRTANLTETLHELETFSYSLSHDMRAPLRAMQGFAEVVLARYAASVPEDGQDLLKRIAAAARRLDHLIKESLAYYRTPREPLPLEPTNIEPLVETFFSEHPELPARETLSIERPLQPVMAHAPSLMQVLDNLLSNAYRFVEPGRTPQVRIWTERVDGQIRICIHDNGIGIAPADQKKIWGLFTRLHPEQFEGTGIGLALVRKAVDRMGGTVGVESEAGKGSKFWLQLQAAQTK